MTPQTAQKLDVLFKPVSGGYVFRAPNPWIVVGTKYYFANEDQKAQILQTMEMRSWVIGILWLAFFALFLGGGITLLYFVSGHPEPTNIDIAIIVVLTIAGLLLPLPLIGYWQLHRLKPILQTLAQTDERISFQDISAGLRKATPAKEYARNTLLFGFVFGIMMFNAGFLLSVAITRGSYTAFIMWSAAAILWGIALVRQGLLAMRKASEA